MSPVAFNHTIVHAIDREESARFFSEMFALAEPYEFGPFLVCDLAHGASFDFIANPDPFPAQHYAFLVTEAEFDSILARIRGRGLEYWADPARTEPNTINRHFGGRGVYWCDPSGHFLEAITVPYGGWKA
ncbi:MAG TPA: VOC family protein [Acidimicrobiales bacterium]|nr:VOC family protein [Acidimicrobiales bacterium]